jgi:nickel-dependent lactate racemase
VSEGGPVTVAFGDRTLAVPDVGIRLDVPRPPPGRPETRPRGDALDRPIGVESLERAFDGVASVVVAVSDPTRETGIARILPDLLERLDRAGVREVAFAVGSGLHRPPTPREVARILGERIAGSHPVHLHDPDDGGRLVPVGRTRSGTEVLLHRGLVEHDAVILTGAVGFHYYAGFSGGRKAVVPGLAGRSTIVSNHLRALRRDGTRHPRARAGVLDGNPVHLDMVRSAAFARPAFLVNTVMGAEGEIEAVFAGHWRRAHEAACRHVRRTRTLRLRPRPLVVVSAGGAPHDIDLVQAHKAFEAAFEAVEPGGTVVLVAACPDGFGPTDFAAGLAVPEERDLVEMLRDDYRVYLQTALAWRRKAAACRLILVSGLDEDRVRAAGAEPARDLEQALLRARRELPEGTPGWLVPHGVRWLLRSESAPTAR